MVLLGKSQNLFDLIIGEAVIALKNCDFLVKFTGTSASNFKIAWNKFFLDPIYEEQPTVKIIESLSRIVIMYDDPVLIKMIFLNYMTGELQRVIN